MRRLAVTLAVCGSLVAIAAATATASPRGRAAAVTRCHTAQLRLAAGPVQGAAGHRLVPLVMRNHSGRACTLRGYPGVSLRGRHGHQIGQAAQRDPVRPVRTITVRPGKAATAELSVVAIQCRRTSRFVRVFPPNAFRSLRTRLRVPACSPRISPVVKGASF
jgi:Protein of unknown function (DUF4232)